MCPFFANNICKLQKTILYRVCSVCNFLHFIFFQFGITSFLCSGLSLPHGSTVVLWGSRHVPASFLTHGALFSYSQIPYAALKAIKAFWLWYFHAKRSTRTHSVALCRHPVMNTHSPMLVTASIHLFCPVTAINSSLSPTVPSPHS